MHSSSIKAPERDGSNNPKGHYLVMSKRDLKSMGGHSEMALNNQHRELYLKHSYKSCVMQFDYFIRTPDHYFIAVRVGTEIYDLKPVYTVAHQADTGGWRKANAHIGPQYSPFFVDIDGYRGLAWRGAIGPETVRCENRHAWACKPARQSTRS